MAVIGLSVGSLSSALLPSASGAIPLISVALSVLLNGLLIVAIWRFHSNVARWIFTLWVVLGGLTVVLGLLFYPGLEPRFTSADILAAVLTSSANVAAVACLFTREAGRWFETGRPTSD